MKQKPKRSRSRASRNGEVSGQFLNQGELISMRKPGQMPWQMVQFNNRRRRISLPISDTRLSQPSTGIIVSPFISLRPGFPWVFRGKTCQSKRFFVIIGFCNFRGLVFPQSAASPAQSLCLKIVIRSDITKIRCTPSRLTELGHFPVSSNIK